MNIKQVPQQKDMQLSSDSLVQFWRENRQESKLTWQGDVSCRWETVTLFV